MWKLLSHIKGIFGILQIVREILEKVWNCMTDKLKVILILTTAGRQFINASRNILMPKVLQKA